MSEISKLSKPELPSTMAYAVGHGASTVRELRWRAGHVGCGEGQLERASPARTRPNTLYITPLLNVRRFIVTPIEVDSIARHLFVRPRGECVAANASSAAAAAAAAARRSGSLAAVAARSSGSLTGAGCAGRPAAKMCWLAWAAERAATGAANQRSVCCGRCTARCRRVASCRPSTALCRGVCSAHPQRVLAA